LSFAIELEDSGADNALHTVEGVAGRLDQHGA
jgi:hypothetical protein